MIVVYSLNANTPTNRIPYITGGGLDDTYQFHSFHLHWGSDSSKGSEHLIRSQRYHVYWFSYSTIRPTNQSRFFLNTYFGSKLSSRAASGSLQHQVRYLCRCHDSPGWAGRLRNLSQGANLLPGTSHPTHLDKNSILIYCTGGISWQRIFPAFGRPT